MAKKWLFLTEKVAIFEGDHLETLNVSVLRYTVIPYYENLFLNLKTLFSNIKVVCRFREFVGKCCVSKRGVILQ